MLDVRRCAYGFASCCLLVSNHLLFIERNVPQEARGCETGVTIEYLRGLHAAYEDFIKDISRVIPVIKVDYSQFRTAEEMAIRIADEYERIANIREVHWPSHITRVGAESQEGNPSAEPEPESSQ